MIEHYYMAVNASPADRLYRGSDNRLYIATPETAAAVLYVPLRAVGQGEDVAVGVDIVRDE